MRPPPARAAIPGRRATLPGRDAALAPVGAAISAAGHAAAIGLAVWALPWLRAGPDPGVPVMHVALVGPEALAPSPKPPAPVPPAPEPPSAPPPAAWPDATVPHEDIPVAPQPDAGFAGRFDPEAPFGFPLPGTDAGAGAAGAGPADLDPEAPDGAEATAATAEEFRQALLAAVESAKVYPRIARERGLFGTTEVAVTLGPDGALAGAGVVRSSGSKALDEAALAAVRAARLPVPAPELPRAYDLEISFTLHRD